MIYLAAYLPYYLADEGHPFHFINGALVPILGNFSGVTPTAAVWYISIGL